MSSSSKNPSAFDAIVIGGGLGGLLCARQLENAGLNVAIFEGLDALGGNCRPIAADAPFGTLDHGLKHFPNVAGAADAIAWAESAVGLAFEPELVDAPPVTFDSGRFQPFVGFGGVAATAADEISYYATPQQWRLRATPKDWIAALAQSFRGSVFTQSYVTKLQVENQHVTEVVVNGAKRFSAKQILFCAPPPALLHMVSTEAGPAPARMRQKLAKGDVFTSIHLELTHAAEVVDSAAPHVLKGANEEPCVGLFHPAQLFEDGRRLQRSQWIAFIPADQTDDSELIAAQLKYVKRQIKRAYETSLDGLISERILVCPQSDGSAHGFLGDERLWPKTKNLRAVSAYFGEQRDLIGLLQECRRVTETLTGRISRAMPPEAEAPV